MLSIIGRRGRLCDGLTRREWLEIGGASILGLSLPGFFSLKAHAAQAGPGKGVPGWGKAERVLMVFLQGGPSHIDIWDPKPNAPDNIRSQFKPINTNVPGIQLSEVMPLLAQQADKYTLIRSVSYRPKGLFNHTAAIYQMMTGYTPDRVSPSGQLEPPSPADFPHIGSQVSKIQPPKVPMLPFVMLPRPLQESNVIGKGGTAGFLGRAYDPYYFYKDPNEPYGVEDLTLRAEISPARLERRENLWEAVNQGMPELQEAVGSYALNEYYEKAFDLVLSGRAKKAFDLTEEPEKVRDRYGRHTFGQSLLLARRLLEAGTKFVQVNWPSVANGDPLKTAWDTHASNFGPLKELHCPKLDSGLSALLYDLSERGLLKDTMVVAIGEFGRSPRMGVSTSGNSNAADGRDHWPYCYTGVVAGAGVAGGRVYGKSDEHGSSPVENPVHPGEILATVYHSLGINPETMVLNHLQQPRELVQAKPVMGLL